MLKAVDYKYYKVKQGQTAAKIAEYFRISPRVLARETGLTGEPYAGQILFIPNLKGNAYTVLEPGSSGNGGGGNGDGNGGGEESDIADTLENLLGDLGYAIYPIIVVIIGIIIAVVKRFV